MPTALRGPAFFAYANNYLIDTDHAIIVDVEATRAIRQAEVGAARTMIDCAADRFGLKPKRLTGDSAYGAAPMLAWLVKDKAITPHIPVFDRSRRDDGTLSRADFTFDAVHNVYVCPRGRRAGFMTAGRCSIGHRKPSAIRARSNRGAVRIPPIAKSPATSMGTGDWSVG